MRKRRDWIVVVIVAVLLAAGVVLAGTVAPGATGRASAAGTPSPSPSVVLQVEHNGTVVKAYTLDELEALTPFPGYAGFRNSAGSVTGPEAVTGVKVTDIVQDALSAPLASSQSVDVVDVDPSGNYGMTYSSDQLFNLTGFTMYNAAAPNKEVAPSSFTGPLGAVLIYSDPGQKVMPADEGPLRFVVADTINEGALMVGSDSVYAVNTLNVRDFVAKNWSLKLTGLKIKGKRPTRTITRNDFQGCAQPNCHGSSYKAAGNTWSGVPLYLLVGEVDGGKDMTYNAALAHKGYRIRLTSTTGKVRYVSSRTIIYKSRIVLADQLNGAVLGKSLFPLRLMGPKLASSQKLGRIRSVALLPLKKKK